MAEVSESVKSRVQAICRSDSDRVDGTSYMPSNGTEGEIFTGYWCDRCSKDQFNDGGDSCNILMMSLCGDQPDEWQYQNGGPCCTAFEEKPGK